MGALSPSPGASDDGCLTTDCYFVNSSVKKPELGTTASIRLESEDLHCLYPLVDSGSHPQREGLRPENLVRFVRSQEESVGGRTGRGGVQVI